MLNRHLGAEAGMRITFTDASSTNWIAVDQYGNYMNAGIATGGTRIVDLSGFAGKQVSALDITSAVGTAAGNWGASFHDIALVSADGTVIPIYNGEAANPTVVGLTNGATGQSTVVSNSVGRYDPNFSTMYYHDDQLGTSRMMTSHSGYPIWQGTFLPYGEEYDPQMTMNHFKFTGKERDSENGASGNGLDYFGARYYSSALGRFITPDWVDHPAPVPYANIGNPQTLNLYGYVQNDPLSFVDPDGHCWSWAQHLCNFGQRIRNKWDGYGFRTDAQVEQAVHDAHNWLRQHGVTAEQQEKMTDKQALAVADAARSHKSSVVPDGVRFVLKAAPVVAGALPGANPQWGKNRFIKELQDRGFVYEGPTNSGDGLMYKNPTTGEEVRVMPNPGRTPYRGEPAAKFENDYYYRYRSGPDQAWGPAYNFAK